MSKTPDLRVVDGEGAAAPDRDAWLDEGRAILGRQSAASWEFADWLAEGERAGHGATIRETAEAFGISRGKIGEFLQVSKTYAVSIRMDTLGFSHYRAALRLPEAERERVLQAAVDGGWTVAQTREAVREASTEGRLAAALAENAELRRRLRAAEMDPDRARDVASRARRRFDAGAKAIVREYRETARIIGEVADEDAALELLHGNARLALAAHFERKLTEVAEAIHALQDKKIRPALVVIAGKADP